MPEMNWSEYVEKTSQNSIEYLIETLTHELHIEGRMLLVTQRFSWVAEVIKQCVRDKSNMSMELARLLFVPLETLGHLDLATPILQTAIESSTRTNDRLAEAELLNLLGRTHFIRGEYQQSRKIYQRACSIGRTLNSHSTMCKGLTGLAVALEAQQQWSAALRLHFRALKFATHLADKQLMGLSYGNIGIIQKSVGTRSGSRSALRESLRSHLLALRASSSIGDTRSVMRHYGNIGITLSELRQRPCSYAFIRRANIQSVAQSDTRHQGIWLYSIALHKITFGQIADAEVCLHRASELFEEIGAMYYKLQCEDKLREIAKSKSEGPAL
jgi:tetratricopeptide (TPR) repeat protein